MCSAHSGAWANVGSQLPLTPYKTTSHSSPCNPHAQTNCRGSTALPPKAYNSWSTRIGPVRSIRSPSPCQVKSVSTATLGNPKKQRTASPPRTPPTAEAGAPPRAPPTAEAGAGRPTHQQAAARAPWVQRYPTYGDPAIRGDCSHLKNEDVHDYNKGAKKRRDGNNQRYSNHTDRYQRDAGYRTNCQNHIPPTPEHLYYENGDYAW